MKFSKDIGLVFSDIIDSSERHGTIKNINSNNYTKSVTENFLM